MFSVLLGNGLGVNFPSICWSSFFFKLLVEEKSMSLTCLYDAPFTDAGSSQYDFSSVGVLASLSFTFASIQKRRAAIWVQASPNPAMHVQWAAKTVPSEFVTTHGCSGFSLSR